VRSTTGGGCDTAISLTAATETPYIGSYMASNVPAATA
jgi:hypothetical protein